MNTLLRILKVTDARRDVILAGRLYHRLPWRHPPPPPPLLGREHCSAGWKGMNTASATFVAVWVSSKLNFAVYLTSLSDERVTRTWRSFGHPLQKNSGFRGIIENVLEIDSAKYRNLFQYLEEKVYPEGFTKQDKTTLRKFAKNFEYDSILESLFYMAKDKDGTALWRLVITEEEKARVFEECHCLLFLDTPASIILLGKSNSGFTGLTTARTRWKWNPLHRGF